ncbi:liver-expressed antimicrobial peptide 2 [Solea solea]|uniref:liver-expressed antimicrobial peptide 2 n=1 Tax=Solea solea TaxID=90069 RepID=UPI00272C5B5A|nr:liver-expressed antimicrobial peptide 2 [Solea solea]
MQRRRVFSQGAAAVTLCVLLFMATQQVCAAPPPQVRSSSAHSPDGRGVPAVRRVARMTPLWRIMNSKPFGAYCQNNYECSTGICRGGHCSNSPRSLSEIIND